MGALASFPGSPYANKKKKAGCGPGNETVIDLQRQRILNSHCDYAVCSKLVYTLSAQ